MGETRTWLSRQAEVVSTLAVDVGVLKASLLDLERSLIAFSCGELQPQDPRPMSLPRRPNRQNAGDTVAPQPLVSICEDMDAHIPAVKPHHVEFVESNSEHLPPALDAHILPVIQSKSIGSKSTQHDSHKGTAHDHSASPRAHAHMSISQSHRVETVSRGLNRFVDGVNHVTNQVGTTVDDHDFVNAVDYDHVAKLLGSMTRERDIRQTQKINTAMSNFHCLGVEPERSGLLAKFVHSRSFQQAVAVIIILNAVFIGYTLEEAIRHPNRDLPASTKILEYGFLSIYSVELAMKLCVHGLYFFINHDWHWNNLDAILVILGLQDAVFKSNTPTDGNGFRITFLRIMRLTRVSKMFRVFRVMMFFRELRVLWRCMSGSARSMFWSVIMLAVFYYCFAVVFLNGVAAYAGSDASDSEKESVKDHYGTVWLTMRTLYMASTGGVDWHELGEPLLKVGSLYYGFFLFFIAFAFVAVLNVVTGIFVNDAIQASQSDAQESILAQIEEERQFEETLRVLFTVMDTDADGNLTLEEFCEHLKDGAHWAYLCTLGLEVQEKPEFYYLMCQYLRKQSLDEQGFASACRRFRGTAKYSDVVLLRSYAEESRKMLLSLRSDMGSLKEDLRKSVQTSTTAQVELHL